MIVQVLEQRTKQAKNQLFFDLFIYIFQFIFSLIETECSKMTVSHVRILRVVLLRVDRHVLQQILQKENFNLNVKYLNAEILDF